MDFARFPLSDFLAAVASRSPSPGGGAVAAVTAATSAAISAMALRYSILKSTPDETRASLDDFVSRLDGLREELLRLADDDARAYTELNRLQKLPPDDPARTGLLAAADAAANVPMTVAERSVQILEICESTAPVCSRWLISDLAIGSLQAHAALKAATWNVIMNLSSLDLDRRRTMEVRIAEITCAANLMATRVEALCRCRRPG